jgi:methionyl-tRNA formyltransferase
MRVVMMGTGLFAEPTFEAILAGSHPVIGLVTQPDRVAGAERGSTRQTGKGMKNIALAAGIPVLQPESINTPEGITGLSEWKPDLLVVAAYGQILSKDVLAVPANGGINVHASLLPKYRGAAPIAWAIYHGETKTGVTIIRMSPFLDAGEMLAQESLEIAPDETAGELEARLAPLGAKMTLQVIEQIVSGAVSGIKQDKTQATKAPKLTKEHGLIDWNQDEKQVRNQVRAMQPWPTAYTFFHRAGKPAVRMMVLRTGSSAHVKAEPPPAPGTILPSLPGLWVATRTGALEILEVQPSGKRKMTAAEFLRGHPMKEGDRFGPEKFEETT